jgi:hypothetical protein
MSVGHSVEGDGKASEFVTVGDDGDPWFDPADGLACV